jgi:hypothetical protein
MKTWLKSWKGIGGVVLVNILAAIIFVQHQDLTRTKSELAGLKQRDAVMENFTRDAVGAENFLKRLSPKDALVWAALIHEAKEAPVGMELKEGYNDALSREIPLVVQIRDEYGAVCLVVVGRRLRYNNLSDNFGYITPDLAYYIGSQAGGSVRFDSLNSKTGEVEEGGLWFTTDKNVAWEANIKAVNDVVGRHLKR